MDQQAEDAARSLHKAMEGIGSDKDRIIKEIVSHSNSFRQLIKEKYLSLFGKRLEDEIKSETSGHFQDGILGLLEKTSDYEAKCLRKAIKGIINHETVAIGILCAKEAHEVEEILIAYKRLFDRDLDADLKKEGLGLLGRILRSITTGGREVSTAVSFSRANKELAKQEAQELYDAGEGKLGTEESVFIRILCTRCFSQLNATYEAYTQLSGKDIEKVIKAEMSGNLEKACLAIVKSARDKASYYAESLHDAMKGFGTNDDELIRILVTRSESDLKEIKDAYKKLYNKDLYDAVKSEISGHYEKLFLALIGK